MLYLNLVTLEYHLRGFMRKNVTIQEMVKVWV